MLGNVEPTQYDLRFTIFGIPVRVHPFFWLLAAFIVWDAVSGQRSAGIGGGRDRVRLHLCADP